jgi:hypothetical protein
MNLCCFRNVLKRDNWNDEGACRIPERGEAMDAPVMSELEGISISVVTEKCRIFQVRHQ